MKIPDFARLMVEEFKELEWFSKLAFALNKPLELITKALQNRLSFEDNFASEVIELRLDGQYPIILPFKLGRPKHILVTRINSGIVTFAPFVDWTTDGQDVKITDVLGVIPSGTNIVKLTIVIIAGDNLAIGNG